jgi:hypothetical protein
MPEIAFILAALMLLVVLHRHDRRSLVAGLFVHALLVAVLFPVFRAQALAGMELPARYLASLLALGGLLLVRKGGAEKRWPYILAGLLHAALLTGWIATLSQVPGFRFAWLGWWLVLFLLATWTLESARVTRGKAQVWNDPMGLARASTLPFGLAVLLGLAWAVVILKHYPADPLAGWCLLASALFLGVAAVCLKSAGLTILAIAQVLMMHSLYFLQARPDFFGREYPAMSIVLALATLGLGVFADKGVVYRHAQTHARWITVFHALAWLSYALATFMLGSMIYQRMSMLGGDPAWYFFPQALLAVAFVLAAGFWHLPKLTGVVLIYAVIMAVLGIFRWT